MRSTSRLGASRAANGKRGDLLLCVGLFIGAAVVRLLFLAGTVDRDLPFSIFYYGDSRIYREFALALIRGDVFDQGIPFHPPAFAYLLSWIIDAIGERPTLLRSVLGVLGAAVVPLTYLLGRTLWNRAVAVGASLLATFSFALCVISVSANAETIYLPLLVAQALLLVWLGDALERHDQRAVLRLVVLSGVVLGLSALTRAEHLGFVAIIPVALWISGRTRSWRAVAISAAGIATIGLVVILPWTLHNHTELTRFNAANPGLPEPLPTWVAVSATGPLVFALANNPSADGTFRPEALVERMGGGQFDPRDPAQLDLYLHGYRHGLSFLGGDLPAAGALIARKLAVASDAHALGFGLSNWPAGLTGIRRPVDLFTPEREIWKPIALLLLLAGVWVSRAQLRRGAIVWLAVLHGVAVSMAFFGYARFFVQALPFVFLFQAAALAALVSRIRAPEAQRKVKWVVAALVAALCVELVAASARPRNFRASGSIDPATGKIMQDAAIRLAPATR